MLFQIETELKQLPDVCDLLSAVTTLRDLVKVTGGRPEEPLTDCLARLRLKRLPDRQAKAVKGARLAHLDCLVSRLRLSRAVLMASYGQDPFSDGGVEARELPDERKTVDGLLKRMRPDALKET